MRHYLREILAALSLGAMVVSATPAVAGDGKGHGRHDERHGGKHWKKHDRGGRHWDRDRGHRGKDRHYARDDRRERHRDREWRRDRDRHHERNWRRDHDRRQWERRYAYDRHDRWRDDRRWRDHRRHRQVYYYDWNRPDPRYRGYYADRYYRGGYDPIYVNRHTRIYRGYDNRYYCRRDDGTTGLIIGAALGALLGNSLERGQSGLAATLIGGGAGALLGRELDRGDMVCR